MSRNLTRTHTGWSLYLEVVAPLISHLRAAGRWRWRLWDRRRIGGPRRPLHRVLEREGVHHSHTQTHSHHATPRHATPHCTTMHHARTHACTQPLLPANQPTLSHPPGRRIGRLLQTHPHMGGRPASVAARVLAGAAPSMAPAATVAPAAGATAPVVAAATAPVVAGEGTVRCAPPILARALVFTQHPRIHMCARAHTSAHVLSNCCLVFSFCRAARRTKKKNGRPLVAATHLVNLKES